MYHELILIPILWINFQIVYTSKNTNGLDYLYEKNDWIQVARCEASCTDLKVKNLYLCVKSCVGRDFVKPGKCPNFLENLNSPGCSEVCKMDKHCQDMLKCCQSSCGGTCTEAEGLMINEGLPAIPKDIKISEPYNNLAQRGRLTALKRRGIKKLTRIKSSARISWKMVDSNDITNDHPGTTIFVLEERHNLRSLHKEDQENEDLWKSFGRTKRYQVPIHNKFLQPGRWYQFRVTAISSNGTRGYSEPSNSFMSSILPKVPEIPKNVTVSPLRLNNSTLTVELRWFPPKSDMPIDKYRIFWSRRLFDSTVLDSVLVHQQTISKNKTKLIIKNLELPNLYFLQIQAISHFGNRKLRGEKSGLVFNTTQWTHLPTRIRKSANTNNYVEDLRIEKILFYNTNLKARVRWKPNLNSTGYSITWSDCNDNKYTHHRVKNAAITTMFHYDMNGLKYDCRYKISVRKLQKDNRPSRETFINFTTPPNQKT